MKSKSPKANASPKNIDSSKISAKIPSESKRGILQVNERIVEEY
jgi:hypothetical protein